MNEADRVGPANSIFSADTKRRGNHATVQAAHPLEAFVDEGLRRMAKHRYYPTEFTRMRQQHGTVEAIERLVVTGEIQSGSYRLRRLDMLEWSMEAAVLRFPDRFTKRARDSAEFRLTYVDDKNLRGR